MLKKFLFFITVLYSCSFALTTEEYYNEYINNYIKKEQNIVDYVKQYIYATGDYNVTRNKLSVYYSIDKGVFKNLNSEECSVSNNGFCDDTNTGISVNLDNNLYILTLKNHFNQLNDVLSTKLIYSYKNSPYLPSEFLLSDNDLKIVLDPTIVKYITTVKDIQSYDIYLNTTKPTDTATNVWIKPNNNAILSVYLKDLNNNWFHATDLDKYTLDFNIKINKSLSFDINLIVLPDNAIISFYTDDGKSLESYISKDKKWYPLTTKSSFDIWTGDSEIYQLACVIFNKPSKSLANVGIKDPYIVDPQTFTKYDDFLNGYWNSNNYYIVDLYTTLTTLNFKAIKGSIGYICSVDGTKYDVLYDLKGTGNSWYYLSKDIGSLSYYNSKKSTEKYVITWDLINSRDNSLKLLFSGTTTSANDTVWYSKFLYDINNSVINEKYQFSSSNLSRNVFTSLKNDVYYLTSVSDCNNKANCNGSDKYTHSGWKIDDLYVWIYDGNMLIDAYPVDHPNKMYNTLESGKNAYLLTTNNKIYLKDTDNNGNIVYKEKGTTNFITAKNDIVPIMYLFNNKPSFPKKILGDISTSNDLDISGSNVIYVNDKLVLNDKIQMVNWNININDNVIVSINGNSGDFIFKINKSKGYWVNNTIKQYLTSDTRDYLPLITDNDYEYLTLQVGCLKNSLTDIEKVCRYTNSGLKDDIETEFYVWYYGNTNKSVNNLIDIIQLKTLIELYEQKPIIGYVADTGKNYNSILDSNGNICYQILNDNYSVITKNGKLFPINFITTQTENGIESIKEVHVPINRTCNNIDFYLNSILFADRTDLIGWTNVKEGLSGYLTINSQEYLSKQNSNNKAIYFNSYGANENISLTNVSIFENIYFSSLNTKYIAKDLGATTLYNGGLLINNNIDNGKKIVVDGIFSNNDKKLYVWYENPTTHYGITSLADIFYSENIDDIYNDQKDFIFYNNKLYNSYELLQKTTVNNDICYVDTLNGVNNYEYIIKSDGSKSVTKNNFPVSINCVNAEFYNEGLVVNDMKIALEWTTALNNFSVITPDKSLSNQFYLEKSSSKEYWINNKNLSTGYLSVGDINKIYSKNRSLIDMIPVNNTLIKIYTTDIVGEETNLNLGTRDFYEFGVYANLDDQVENYSNKINNISDYYVPKIIDENTFMLFDNISDARLSSPSSCPIDTTYNSQTDLCKQVENSACGGGTWNGTACVVWSNSAASTLLTKANNGLWYDNCEGEMLSIKNAKSFCSAKGMRLPTFEETYARNINGVPSCSSNWTWTSTYHDEDYSTKFYTTKYTSSTLYIMEWSGTQVGNDDGKDYTRCVTETPTYSCKPGEVLSGVMCDTNTLVEPSCSIGYSHDGYGECYYIYYKITTSSGVYGKENLINVYSIKYNSSTNKYYIVTYDLSTNTEGYVYNLNNFTSGTLITNSISGKKYLVLFDNINKTNIIKPIN